VPTCIKEVETDKYLDLEEATPFFEIEKTYISIKMNLTNPIVSIESTQPEP